MHNDNDVPEVFAGLKASAFEEGFQLLALWSRNIAMLPLEEWIEALNRAESIGPVLDPTLYQRYLADEQPAILKELLEKGLALKAVVMKSQPALARRMASKPTTA